ncbi:Uncharacterised protein [Candidatus Tiddalikarchaeum anstoanum]|nr:Uncharacterised protein [Candidatus Tiddalikarchaeum anstoanum]
MKRNLPHYTCRKNKQTGVTCTKILIDYYNNVPVYEKKIRDLSIYSEDVNRKLLKNNPWKTPILYDLALFAKEEGLNVEIYKEKDSHVKDPLKNIEEYSREREKKCLELGVKENFNEDMETKLGEWIWGGPLLLYINANYLYKQANAGFIWLIVLEYNKERDEIIVYDPLYYTRLPETRSWLRIENTPKRRYISFRRGFFLECWRKTTETPIYSSELRVKKSVKPFIREFIAITK